jgi:2-polyprenyl-3-methyl-5-hydroxy-6-metoxy-1,4-benzoquinol methylase
MSQQTLIYVACPLCAGTQTRRERVVRGYVLERCRCCDLVYANPQLPPDSLLDGYVDRGSPGGLLAFYERVTTPTRLAEYDRTLEDVAAVHGGRGRLLDFGSGAGYFVERAAQHGWEAHGVEVGAWAEQAAARCGLKHFHRGQLADQNFADGFFDVVCTSQVLEHLPSPKNELAEIRRVLRPGGLFYADVPNYRTLPILLGCDDFELNFPMAHVNYFTPRTLAKLLTACGFQVLRTTTSGGLKWENLLGRRTVSEEVRAHHHEPTVEGTDISDPGAATSRPPPLLKRLQFPFVKKVFYQWAQVGMGLAIFARRP